MHSNKDADNSILELKFLCKYSIYRISYTTNNHFNQKETAEIFKEKKTFL